MKNKNFTKEDILRIFTNPFYCLPKIDESLTIDHPPLIDEETFIETAKSLVKQIGVEEYIRNLLENLKGNYINNKP